MPRGKVRRMRMPCICKLAALKLKTRWNLEAAEGDGRHIYALLRLQSMRYEGSDKVSYGRPNTAVERT